MMGLREAAQAIGGRVRGAPAVFSAVSSDSRAIAPGALFVALRGERFDGHDFIDAAQSRGAAAAMVDGRSTAASDSAQVPRIVVDDTRLALGRLAAHWRSRFAIPLIVVTGSNGKTTVKEMIAAILSDEFGQEATLATEGNLNNDIGLPLTLLRLREHHRAAVVEIGMNHRGETAVLAAIAQPTVALINNAQREHQEFMDGVADVAREHGTVFASLAEGGVAVINADDDFAPYWRGLAGAAAAPAAALRIIDFSIERPAAVSARHARSDFGAQIRLSAPEGDTAFSIAVAGAHNVRNAVAAAAAAIGAGATLASVASGLSAFRAVSGRLQKKPGRNGCVLIDDSYNANPDSVRAAIDVLASLPGRRVLVLGDMGEVGDQGEAFHREIGRYAFEQKIDELLALGDGAAHAFAAFGTGAVWYADLDALLHDASGKAAPGTTILIKGSRFMHMERVVAALAPEIA